jgi:Lysylphosphatidylglycerol synthase TM region
VGASPELALIGMAYLIGQLGNWLPVPGGIGGVELGLVGALVLYGLPDLTAAAAVLLYRVIELWIPALLGIAAFVQLRLLLRRETETIKLCKPGDTIEIVGLGPATIDRAEAKSTATATHAPAA